MEKKQIPIIALAVLCLLLIIPFNLAFATETIHYRNLVNQDAYIQCANNNNQFHYIFVGEEFIAGSSVIGDTFNKIRIFIARTTVDQLTGNVVIGVWDSTVAPTATNYKRHIATLPISSIPQTGTSFGGTGFNFTIANGYTVAANDMIGVYANVIEGTLNCENGFISLRSSNTNQFDGVNSRETRYNTFTASFTDTTTRDVTGLILFNDQITSSTGLDCSLPENVNILICRLGGDGTLGSAGAFVVGNTTKGTGLLGIGCSTGLVDCTKDSNPQTNGLGLLIFIASIFVIIGMFFATMGKDTFHMPIFIWIVIILALSAFFTITGLIDPVFLVLSVIAIIALAVPKVMTIVRGNSSFGGGSTE